jgi:hypothetical protein
MKPKKELMFPMGPKSHIYHFYQNHHNFMFLSDVIFATVWIAMLLISICQVHILFGELSRVCTSIAREAHMHTQPLLVGETIGSNHNSDVTSTETKWRASERKLSELFFDRV